MTQLLAQSLNRVSHTFIESYEYRKRHHSDSYRSTNTPETPLHRRILVISSDILDVHAKI